MFDGRCAYCGEPLADRWHADHVEPVMRGVGSYWSGLPAARMENHRIDNMMPACAPCNISKATFSIDQWRLIIAGHVAVLDRNQPTYRLAKKYGLISETKKPVEFYFERIAAIVE
uniref:HNH endonuclease n=1 Tax=Caballeronia sp. LjRoot34 TaxID=3342325 RepID=UPI003F5084CE